MTERERLATALGTAGLVIADAEINNLLPAWKRYRALVAALREATAAEDLDP